MDALAGRVPMHCTAAFERNHSCQDVKNWARYGNGNEWKDPTFPADASSLYWPSIRNEPRNEMKRTYVRDVNGWISPRAWVRDKKSASAKDTNPKTGLPYLWGEKGVRPYGTRQGRLGDCWFLAAASSIAEHPERLKKIFTNKEYPKNGVFQVTMHEMDDQVPITIDDQLPIREGKRRYYSNYGVKELENADRSEGRAWW